MIWKKKCPTCKKKYRKAEPFHEVRLELTSQILVVEICEQCANVLDEIADSLNGKRSNESI